jgi:hypothetical protein
MAVKQGQCWPVAVMGEWDYWRREIANGNTGSAPRDWFENLAELRLVAAPVARPHSIEFDETQGAQVERNNLQSQLSEAQLTIDNLRTVMMAAAVEISAHWDAHCDNDGCGPVNLVRRLEKGLPEQYGYNALTVVNLEKQRDDLQAQLAELRATHSPSERELLAAANPRTLQATLNLITELNVLRADLETLRAQEPVDAVLTYDGDSLVKVQIAGKTHYEVDLSPMPYFQVCWAYGWSGSYDSEEEAMEDCVSLCGHHRSIRKVNPEDGHYRNPRTLQLTEKRFPIFATPNES